MKDLVEFAQAKAAGCEFEYKYDSNWVKFNYPTWESQALEDAIEHGLIRIKPVVTYYRVYKSKTGTQSAVYAVESDKAFPDMSDPTWENFKLVFPDVEIEQPVPDNETITLYEHKHGTSPDANSWAEKDIYVSRTGRTITAVIKGDVS